ncbi:ATPase, T2SS/T4P/T4SS family [Streptobacillus felis]|uniref:Flp pilus assembly complex ATPase component TadA n=1 Tax=Streptobacillus felis TaxID=1384509 RepID=A0A7Z0PFN4_9FUSO|nr:ATPase, T2SS/T4P/T4SS family [Streptobacillus felis]NYV28389.1 Flp pilus assembly complex ATPase component TadA [Streptobacillus felis]
MGENLLQKATTLDSCFLFNLENILDLAINTNATDIHIREYVGKCKLELRINGNIKNISNVEKLNVKEIIARIKILSKLNVAEKRLPQDGSFTYTFMNKKYDIRVATLPSFSGENVVLRILNSTLKDISLKALGFEDYEIKILNEACLKSHGLILITGPTGSGKSTTLLSLIHILMKSKRKIISIEDPIENKIESIVQVQVKEEIGLSFDRILKTVLRSDPDIIVISEIRDEITAQIAIRAALTGHLVLATLHTNDSISTLNRLIDMNIPKYLILDSLLCILSQRLIFNGYKRICLSEILKMDDEIKNIFSNNTDKIIIEEILKNKGYMSLKEKLEKRCDLEKYYSL